MKKLLAILLAIAMSASMSGILRAQEESALGEEEVIASEGTQQASSIMTEKIFDYYTLNYPTAFIQKKGKMAGTLILRKYQLKKDSGAKTVDSEPNPITATSILANFAVTNNIEVVGGFDFTGKIISDPTGRTSNKAKIIQGIWGVNVVLKQWKNGSTITAGYRYSTTDPDTQYLSSNRVHIVASKPLFKGRIVYNFGLLYNKLDSWLFDHRQEFFYNTQLMHSFDFKLFSQALIRLGLKDETDNSMFMIVPGLSTFSMIFALNYKPSDDYRFSFFYEKINDEYKNSVGDKLTITTETSTIGLNLTFLY